MGDIQVILISVLVFQNFPAHFTFIARGFIMHGFYVSSTATLVWKILSTQVTFPSDFSFCGFYFHQHVLDVTCKEIVYSSWKIKLLQFFSLLYFLLVYSRSVQLNIVLRWKQFITLVTWVLECVWIMHRFNMVSNIGLYIVGINAKTALVSFVCWKCFHDKL